VTDTGRRLSFLFCKRPLAATAGESPPLALALTELGHDVRVLEGDGPLHLASCDVVLLWNNPTFFPLVRRQLLAVPPEERPVVATFHAEPLPPPRASRLPRWSAPNRVEAGRMLRRAPGANDIHSNAMRLRRIAREGWLDLIFATSLEKVEYLEEQGIRSWYVPYGYHPSFGTLLGLERTIDVLFLGDQGPFRRRRLLRYLGRRGIAVETRGNFTDPYLRGEARSRLLNQTKIVVHLQRYPGKLAAMRLVLALANGAMVVAEPCYRPDPFVPGVHYAEAPIRELPDLIRYYLAHDEERERIAAAGHRLVTEELTFARSAQTVVDVVREHLDGGELGGARVAAAPVHD
jgi:glycosyltransferase involved in cell wall biosynthesis